MKNGGKKYDGWEGENKGGPERITYGGDHSNTRQTEKEEPDIGDREGWVSRNDRTA